jgi:RNA polymerase-binding transcription factor DksA
MDHDTISRRLRQARQAIASSRAQVESDQLVGTSADEGDQPRGDVVDIANRELETELDETLVGLFGDELAEIDAAEARLAAGTYGRCQDCGAPIEAARLVAVPWARYCTTHQQSRERDHTGLGGAR